jgi:hypothetical protein
LTIVSGFQRGLVRLWRKLARAPRLFAAVVASLLIVATFPDVLIVGTSLRLSDQLWGSYENLELFRVHPLVPTSLAPLGARYGDWILSYNDIGGSLWQSEPMMEFMRYSLWTLDSPYWNPYSSAGALGPETLVDLKFSAFTLAYAAFGGGAVVYNALLLAAYWLATYFVVRVAREKLKLSALACTAAGVFYLLNGYSTANVGSNVSLSYLVIPSGLYAALAFAEARTRGRFAVLGLALTPLLSFTFLPTTIMAVVAILACTLGYVLALHWRKPGIGRAAILTVVGTGLAIAAALGVLAVIYLPFAESLELSGLAETYAQRVFYPAFWTGALSLFTPFHFFRSAWGNMDADAARLAGNTIYCFGVLGLLLGGSAWRGLSDRWGPLVWSCVVVVAVTLARIFGAPVISDVIGLVPVVRNLGSQYLWVTAAVPMTLLVGLGTDALRNGTAAWRPMALVVTAGVAAGVTLAVNYGLREPDVDGKLFALTSALVLATTGLSAGWMGPRVKIHRRPWIAGIIVFLLFAELAAAAGWLRYQGNDRFAEPTSEVPFLQSRIGNYRTMTLGAYATTLERGAAYQLQEITSLNMGTLPSYQDYFKKMTRGLPQQYRMGDFVSLAYPQDAPDLNYYDWSLINLLGVKYVIVPKTSVQYLQAFTAAGFRRVHDSLFTVVFENPDVLPRAFTVDVVRDGDQATLPTDLVGQITPATIATYRNTYVEITGVADRPSLVVLTDNWHSNWSALRDGVPAAIVRVNETFRGVWVPAGEFKIEMSYQPRTLPVALVLSLVSLLALSALSLSSRFRSSSKPAGFTT